MISPAVAKELSMPDTKMKSVVAQLPVLRACPLWFSPPDPIFHLVSEWLPTGFQTGIWETSVSNMPEIGHPGSNTRITQALTTPAHLPGDVIAGTSVLAGASQKQGNESTATLGNWELTPCFASFFAP